MRLFQCVAITALLAVANSQYLQGGYFPPRRQVSDSALHKFLSAVRGGGRGHRELMSLTGSASSNRYSSLQGAPTSSGGFGLGLPFFGLSVGRLPPSVNHIQAPPKVGAFYITPPERNAPFYYSSDGVAGKKPQLVKITDLKNGQPLQFLPSESINRPRHHPSHHHPLHPLMQMIFSGPGPVASASNAVSQPGGQPIGPEGAQGNSGSLQEIIAKAAQQQHALVLQKEQKAHPNAQINSQILVPGAGHAGQQPVFINQFGQPFLAPAILSAGQHGQPQNLPPQLLAGQQGGFLIGQGSGPVPPQALLQQIRQSQGIAGLNSLNGEIPEHILKAQQQNGPQQQPQQQLQHIQVVNPGIQFGPQGQPIQLIQGGPGGPQRQRLPISIAGQQLPPGAQIFGLPQGAPHIVPSQFAILPQGLRGPQGQFIPGNAILGQPHFAFLGGNGAGPNSQGQKGLSAAGSALPGPTGSDKEEQPTRPHEAASQNIASIAPLNKGSQAQMTAAVMQSQLEFSEPIVKL